MEKEIQRLNEVIQRDNLIIESLSQWILVEHEKKSISKLINEMNYKKIAIYGYGHLGRLLESLIDKDRVEIKCIVDRNFTAMEGYMISPNADYPYVDVFLVTNAFFYEEIRNSIIGKNENANVMLLDELLYQL